MANHLILLLSFLLVAFATSISSSHFHQSENQINGFSVDLIHRDTSISPLYNHSLTPLESWTNSLRRSFNRIHHFEALVNDPRNITSIRTTEDTKKSSTNYSRKLSSASTTVIPDKGEYLMIISIGSPPVPTPVIVDSGSDIIWTQCQPCVGCFKQKTTLFNPVKSSTYEKATCQSQACKALPDNFFCDSRSKYCQYGVGYGDESFSKGDVATDTITLGTTAKEKVSFHKIIFGCGHENQGNFGTSAGIVGLGKGKTSLLSQMGSSIRRRFSYCLTSSTQTTKHSRINFGDNAVVSGPGVVTTPIAPNTGKVFYYLTLEGVSVGEKRLKFKHNKEHTFKAAQEGNIFIDSGTTLSFLPSQFYKKLESEVRVQINKTTVTDPQEFLTLCYTTLGPEETPTITMHFKGGDVKLHSYNAFVQTGERSICLAFASRPDIAIYGNIAQIDFLVGYDLEKQTISFKAADCTK